MTATDEWIGSLFQWAASALSSPLGLVVIGGVATLAGGVGGALLLGNLESRREAARDLATHKAALRAVVYELTNNQASLTTMKRQGSLRGMYLSSEVYNSAMLPLFSRLPRDLPTELALAYGLIFALRETKEFGLVEKILAAVERSRANLLQYAKDLSMFMPD